MGLINGRVVATYSCPLDISKLFRSEQTLAEGRRRAIEWTKSLNLNRGDQVWLPEGGWMTVRETREQ